MVGLKLRHLSDHIPHNGVQHRDEASDGVDDRHSDEVVVEPLLAGRLSLLKGNRHDVKTLHFELVPTVAVDIETTVFLSLI